MIYIYGFFKLKTSKTVIYMHAYVFIYIHESFICITILTDTLKWQVLCDKEKYLVNSLYEKLKYIYIYTSFS